MPDDPSTDLDGADTTPVSTARSGGLPESTRLAACRALERILEERYPGTRWTVYRRGEEP